MAATDPGAPTPSLAGKQRLDYIDVLRALAVVAVFAVHVRAFWVADGDDPQGIAFVLDRIAAQGSAGVELFIVLSGFCMAFPLVRGGSGRVATVNARRFWRRRAIRLAPAYYAALAVVVGMLLVPSIQTRLVGRPIEVWDVVAYSLFVQPFDSSTVGAINGPLWSISLEVTLYLLFPLTLLMLRRFGWTCLVVASIAIAALWFAFGEAVTRGSNPPGWSANMNLWLPVHYFEFVAGMLAAYLVCNPERYSRLTQRIILLLPLGVAVGSLGTIEAVEAARIFGWGSAAFCLTLLLSRASAQPRVTGVFRRVATLGVVSYSFYLLHQPLILLTASLVRSLDLPDALAYPVLLPAGVFAMAVVARLFFVWVERPFLVRGGIRDAIRRDADGQPRTFVTGR